MTLQFGMMKNCQDHIGLLLSLKSWVSAPLPSVTVGLHNSPPLPAIKILHGSRPGLSVPSIVPWLFESNWCPPFTALTQKSCNSKSTTPANGRMPSTRFIGIFERHRGWP